MEARILAQGVKDPPVLADIRRPLIDLTHNEKITFVVIEKGMQSGEPAVIISSEDEEGSIALQTSLDKFMSGAMLMAGIAENQWGWVRPEGYATLMPPDKKTRKALLEQIKKELEEWEEIDP